MATTHKVLSFLVLVGIFGCALSLDCNYCESETSWDDCDKNAQQRSCNLIEVNGMHAVMVALNPALDQGTAADTFQCFAIHARLKKPGTSGAQVGFTRACTFARTKICQGWDADRVEVIECSGSGSLYAYGMLIVAGLAALKLRM